MYRPVDTALWGDKWFQALPPMAKYLYLYLRTNGRTTACGAYEITRRTIAFEMGLDEESIVTALAALPIAFVQYWPAHEYVFVISLFADSGIGSGRFFDGAVKQAKALPEEVRRAVYDRYPALCDGPQSPPRPVKKPSTTPQLPVTDPSVTPLQPVAIPSENLSLVQNRTEQEQSRKEQTPTAQTREGEVPATVARDFNAFMRAYPAAHRGFVNEAKKEWLAVFNTGDLPEILVILRALNEQKESTQWTKDGGKFAPNMGKYIQARMWEAPPVNDDPKPKRVLSQTELNAPAPGRLVI